MGLLDDAIREHLELKRQHGASDEELERAEQEALAPARRDPNAGAGVPPVEEVPGEPVAGQAEGDPPPPPPPPPEAAEAGIEEPTAIEPPPEGADNGEDDSEFTAEYAVQPRPLDPDAPEPAIPAAFEAAEQDDEHDYLAPEPLDEGPAAHPPLESTQPIEPPSPDEFEGEQDAPTSFDDEYEPDEVPSDEQLGGAEPPADPYRARTSILDDPLGELPTPPAEDQPTQQRSVPEEPPSPEGEQDVLEETPDFLQETPEHDKLWFEQKPPRDFDFD